MNRHLLPRLLRVFHVLPSSSIGGRIGIMVVCAVFLFGVMLSAPVRSSVRAQEQSAAVRPRSVAAASPATATADDHYRIGPGDVLDIKVFNKPQFNREGVKVDPRGMIRIPLIKEEIRAACRTEEELAAEVTSLLK